MDIQKTPYIDLGNELRALRGGLTKKDFAHRLGIHAQSYYRYESGEREVPATILEKARALRGEANLNVGIWANVPKDMTAEESALINALRMLGPEYTRQIYFAVSEEARFRIEDGKLEVKNKLEANRNISTLASASILKRR